MFQSIFTIFYSEKVQNVLLISLSVIFNAESVCFAFVLFYYSKIPFNDKSVPSDIICQPDFISCWHNTTWSQWMNFLFPVVVYHRSMMLYIMSEPCLTLSSDDHSSLLNLNKVVSGHKLQSEPNIHTSCSKLDVPLM